MIKILEINSVPYGSTCQIMLGISNCGNKAGLNINTASGYSTHPIPTLPNNHIRIGGVVSKFLHIALSKITGYDGCFSYFATRSLLKNIKKEKYDILHFHNLHGWYINLPMLFRFVKKNRIPIVWTLHDCWPFTGHCPHFTVAKCDKWKSECFSCPQYQAYPGTVFDNSNKMFSLKKEWFTGVSDLTIATPSLWLSKLVKQSFLKEYDVKVINNGINLSVFKPIQGEFRKKHSLENKYIVLGVSFGWNDKKGLDVFIELSNQLSSDYQIILVGTDEGTDEQLPKNILSIHRTQNQKELAELYSTADVFVNPTREDTYPTVNMEALACGAPVLTFKTGGSPEIIDSTCGSVVDANDIFSLKEEIIRICESKPYSQDACTKKSKAFEMNDRFNEYIDLYKVIYDRASKSRA